MPNQKIKYIDNDINKGIIVDWKHIFKLYKKLNCPKDVYNPCTLPIGKAKYSVLLSERKTGKTTNLLLLGMLLYLEYGIVTQYIRATENMVQRRNTAELFTTIIKFGYIEKMTNGQYNNVYYFARKWYFCKTDESGEVLEQDPNHFMFCLAVELNETYKSSYNCPTGDFILYDEFIRKTYRMNEFVDFIDLLSTIIRDRLTANIVLIANTIDRHSEYFNELEIYDDIQLIEVGQREIIETELGTKIYVELIADLHDKKEKSIYNTLYFGFKNPKINAVRGGEWAVNNYPHIQKGFETIQRGIYIEYHGRLLALDIVKYEDVGVYINVHTAYRTYDDSIIYTLQEPKDKRYRYYMGTGTKLDRFIVKMVKAHKIRFQNNACGTMFFNHFNQKDAKKGGY